MKRSNIAFAVLLLAVPCCFSFAKAADETQATETTLQQTDRSWGLAFAEIPDVLRMHLPALGQRDSGLLVAQTDRSLPGAQLGLQVGDVILLANGRNVTRSTDLPKPTPDTRLMVLRRGQIITVPMQNAPAGFFGGFAPQLAGPFAAAPFAAPPMPGFAAPVGGVSASSFSGGNESVAVSRSGDQISLDMSLPDLTDTPIRLRGSIGQIQQQLRESQLPAAAKQRVMQAINQNL